MSDQAPDDTRAGAMEPRIEGAGERRWPSPVWLVPLLAVLAALGLLIQNLATRGPLITIELATASGLVAGETQVRYRDVGVGRVEDLRFSPDLGTVLAEVRMSRDVAPFLDESARFWVVKPQVSAQGITGLETVLTGSYIQGSWDTEPGTVQSRFVAEETPPMTPDGTPGLRLLLRAVDGGSLEVGSPIFFKRVEVGRVESKRLTEDGSAVEFEVFINAPNDKRVTAATRFWNASGVDLQLGADGARLKIASLASLLRGGASFDTVGTGEDTAVEPGRIFPLYPSESEARENVIAGDLENQVTLQILFGGSVRGLKPGASVEYRGIRIGRVSEVRAAVDPQNGRFRTRTIIQISPALLGFAGEEPGEPETLRFLRQAVESGLRAKLAMGNLLTGSLFVDLADVADAPPATLDESGETPTLPAVASDLDELTGSVEGVLDRVDALPIEALVGNAVALLDNLNRLAGSEDTQAIPGQARGVLSAAEALVAGPELKQVTTDAQALVAALRGMAEDPGLATAPEKLGGLLTSLASIVEELERADSAGSLARSLSALEALTADPAFARLPASADATLAALTAMLDNPALSQLPGEINTTLAELRSTLTLPGVAELPGDLRAALASLQTRLDDPGLAQATAELGPLLAEARRSLETLSGNLDPTLVSLREILDDPGTRAAPAALTESLQAAQALLADPGLKTATAEAGPTLAALRTLLDAPGTQAAPEELAATLRAAKDLLVSLEREGAARNLSQTLAAARRLIDDPALLRASSSLAQTMDALSAVLAAPGAEELPAATTQALRAASALIDQFQRENLGGAAAGAMSGIADASRAVERSVSGVPALLQRLNEVSARADALLASLSVGSELNYEAITAIREIRDAARAVSDLADLVQQKPNSIILGK